LAHPATQANPDTVLLFAVPYLLATLTYWLLGTLFLVLDFVPAIARRMHPIKIQPSRKVTLNAVFKCVRRVFVLHFTVNLVGGLVSIPLMKPFIRVDPELPGLVEFLSTLPVYILGAEVWFYYGHRLLHHPKLYPHCHKVHHEYKSPFALAALYSHPLEVLQNAGVVNFGPLLMGCMVQGGTHALLYYIWSVLATQGILVHHSGYELPLDGVPGVIRSMSDFHDFHHQVFNQNYGVLGLLDWLHGTAEGYQGWVWVEHHKNSEAEGIERLTASKDKVHTS